MKIPRLDGHSQGPDSRATVLPNKKYDPDDRMVVKVKNVASRWH